MKRSSEIVKWLRRRIRQFPWSRYNLRRIKGIEKGEIDGLRQLGDQEALQKELDGYPGAVFSGLASRTGLTKSRLLGLLQESLELWSKPHLFRRAGRHWADVVLAAVITLLAAESFSPPPKAYRVVAAREVPPFQQIQRDDLKEVPSDAESRETAAQYVGKYTVSSVHEGSALSQSDISPGLASLRIEIKNSVVSDKATLPQAVLLVFSSRKPPTSGTTIPALLSKIEPTASGQVAILQIPSGQQAEAAKWLGSADAYIMLRVP